MTYLLAALISVGLGADNYAVRRDTTAVVGLANQFVDLDAVLDRAARSEDLETRWRASALRGALFDLEEVSPLRFIGHLPLFNLDDADHLRAALAKAFQPSWCRRLATRHLSERNAVRVLAWCQIAGVE